MKGQHHLQLILCTGLYVFVSETAPGGHNPSYVEAEASCRVAGYRQ